MTVLLEGYEQGYLQVHHKLHIMQEGEGKDTAVSPADDKYTGSTFQQDCH